MIDLKSKITDILSEAEIDQIDEGLFDLLKNIFSSKEKIKPFKDEKELLEAFGAHNFPQIIISDKFLEIFKNAYPQKVFIDHDEDGVYFGAYFATDKMVINIGADFSGTVRTEVFGFTKPPRPPAKKPASAASSPTGSAKPFDGLDNTPRLKS